MTVELLPPQRKAVDRKHAAFKLGPVTGDWSETGTGKTIMNLFFAAELGLPSLVVAPIAAQATWRRWAAEIGILLLDVVNVEKLRSGKTPWVKVKGAGKQAVYEWQLGPAGSADANLILWDEIHRGLLGADSQTARMAAMLRPQGIYTALMSATPFNSPLNARALGYLFRLHNWSASSFYSWCRAHGCTHSPWHSGMEFNVEGAAAKAHLARINAALRDRCVRLTVREDMAQFFPEGNVVEPYLVKLNERDEEEARRIYAEMDAEVKKEVHANMLVAQTRARQRCELLKIPAMAEMVQDEVEAGNNVFVCMGYLDSVDAMVAELHRIGIRAVVTIKGGDSAKERQLAQDLFQSDLVSVLVSSPAGGESISLHQTRKDQKPRASLISPTYSASQLVQSLGRIKRTGMLDPVVQRIVLCAGTIEERVARRLEAKSRAIETITDSDLE